MMYIRNFMITAIVAAAMGACATEQVNGNTSVTQIQSARDLETHLQTTPDSPLNRMSPDARQRFVDSLVFTDRGLASYRYVELQSLSTTDVFEILNLFGVERTAPTISKETAPSNFSEIIGDGDREGYWCSSHATCSVASGSICTSNC